MPKNMTWQDAAITVLKQSGTALHYTEIADRIIEQKLKATVGATPAATVGAQLYTLAKKPDAPIEQVGKGIFRIRPTDLGSSIPGGNVPTQDETQEPDLEEGGLLRAFGMFWQRENVIWQGQRRLLGKQRAEAEPVNFAEQIGVYLLHDRDRVVYVGRASDSLFTRLQAHTGNRLAGRWDRFSWFGLRPVDPESGKLLNAVDTCSQKLVVETLEALLMESLEPPLNRRRGDGLETFEYYQVPDPDIENRRRKEVLNLLARHAGL